MYNRAHIFPGRLQSAALYGSICALLSPDKPPRISASRQIAEEISVNSCYLIALIGAPPYSRYLLRIEWNGRTGFVSSRHFIAVFKKYYRTMPSAYILR